MFASPPEQSLEWSDSGVEGAHRFLKRLWAFCHQHRQSIIDVNDLFKDGNGSINWSNTEARLKKTRLMIHQLLAQASHDYERQQFNTVVSSCMKLFNELSSYEFKTEEDSYLLHSGLQILLQLLAPITPHICHYLWQQLNFEKIIIDAAWPRYDKNALKTDEVDFVVQVNGKRRAAFTASTDTSEEALIALAIQHAAAFLENKSLANSIVVAHRQLINLVVR
jgi:leucyl-tRNA synthetase